MDKKAEKERLKQLVTASSAYLENKGMNATEIPFHGKLIICSNDADRVMKIDEGESRWFVVKVPQLPSKKVKGSQLIAAKRFIINGSPVDPEQEYEVPDTDPDLENKMMKEIPAFLHFLRERSIFHPRVDRLWFDPECFITDQMRLIVETTKNRIDRVFEDWISEQFLTYKESILRYPLSYLTEVFNDPRNSKYRVDNIELKTYLVEKRGLRAESNPQRVDIPIGLNEDLKPNYLSKTARPYVFRVEEWLTDEQLEEWRKPVVSANGSIGVTSFTQPAINGSSQNDSLPF